MTEKTSQFPNGNSSKASEKSNFQNFIGPARFIPIPTFLTSLVQEQVLTHAQFSAAFHLYVHCFTKNTLKFSLSLSKLAEVMFCSERQAFTLTKILNANSILFCKREKGNGLHEYRWNVNLWKSTQSVSQNLQNGVAKFARPSSKNCETESQNLQDVYIQEFLLEYLFKISLNNVRDAWRARVENHPDLLVDNDGLSRPVMIFLNEKVAAWEAAVTEAAKAVPLHLLVLFFKHRTFDASTITDPTKYLTACFSDGATAHELNKQHSFMFENSVEFFGLYGEEMQSELNAGGYQ